MSKENFNIPVVLFVFVRIDTVKLIVEKFQQIQPRTVYIFSDAARDNKVDEVGSVQQVRDYIKKNITWECDATIVLREKNVGCAENICQGLDFVFAREPYAIIFEDDAVPKLDFFYFCNHLLHKYKEQNIQFIAGFNAIGKTEAFDTDYAFSKSAPMSGAIATWADRWNECDFSMKAWPNVRNTPDFKKLYYSKELYHVQSKAYEDSYKNINAGWDYQFHFDMIEKNRYAIVPQENLAKSYGYTEGAFHPQSKRQARNLNKIMDYGDFQVTIPMKKEPQNIELCCVYDRLRQKKLLEVNGNYVQRHLQYLILKIKEITYHYMPRTIWKCLKHIIKNDN